MPITEWLLKPKEEKDSTIFEIWFIYQQFFNWPPKFRFFSYAPHLNFLNSRLATYRQAPSRIILSALEYKQCCYNFIFLSSYQIIWHVICSWHIKKNHVCCNWYNPRDPSCPRCMNQLGFGLDETLFNQSHRIYFLMEWLFKDFMSFPIFVLILINFYKHVNLKIHLYFLR